MTNCLHRFTLPKGIARATIEKIVAEAVFVAECLHGPAKVRLGMSYYIAPGRPQCVIDTSTEIGEQVAQLVAGLMARQLGETAFRVERIAGSVAPAVP